jgi:hypothetical protein
MNGIVLSQFPINENDRIGTLTLLTHSSGEYMGEAFTLPLGQQNAQTGVAAVTYARRTGYLAALGIASEDDDGQTASGREDDTTSYTPVGDFPDFQEAQHTPARGPVAPKSEKTSGTAIASPKAPSEAPIAAPPTSATSVDGSPAPVSAPPEHGDAYEGPDDSAGALPTETEMADFRARFVTLSKNLAAKQALSASKGLKLNDKLRTFLVQIVGAENIKVVTKAQWDNFFERADAALANPAIGYIGLGKLVNKANGIDVKE